MALKFRNLLGVVFAVFGLSACATQPWAIGGSLGYFDADLKGSAFSGSVDERDLLYALHARLDPGQEHKIVWEVEASTGGEISFDGEYEGFSDRGKIEPDLYSVRLGYDVPVGNKFTVGGRIGATYADVDESEVFDGFPERSSASDVDPTVGVLVNYRINDKWSVGASLDRHFDVGEKNETGEGDMDVLALRLERRFGG